MQFSATPTCHDTSMRIPHGDINVYQAFSYVRARGGKPAMPYVILYQNNQLCFKLVPHGAKHSRQKQTKVVVVVPLHLCTHCTFAPVASLLPLHLCSRCTFAPIAPLLPLHLCSRCSRCTFAPVAPLLLLHLCSRCTFAPVAPLHATRCLAFVTSNCVDSLWADHISVSGLTMSQ